MPPRHPKLIRRCATTLVALATILGTATSSGDVTGAQVRRALERGVRAIHAQQSAQGTWPERYYPGGHTCLATFALLMAGENADSSAVKAALPHIRALENKQVYVVSLKIMALAAADPKQYERDIFEAARWLWQAQRDSGLWNYMPNQAGFDHSNSQFAMLGLHAAAQAGIKVPQGIWNSALAGVLRTQNDDGGWSYRTEGDSYGSMTAAGVSDLLILGARLLSGRERSFVGGKAEHCGHYRMNDPLARGLTWLAGRFDADRNPGRGNAHVYYWLYAAERCGIFSGKRYFGRHDWYREGAEWLVRTQRADGTWTQDLENTCFAVLFLAKGHKPIVLQKLQWSEDDRWTPDRYDADHLVAFIERSLEEPVAWQVVHFDAPLEQWLASPLLYMHGHEFPKWSEAQRAKVRAYIEQGGTLLAEACCGQREFREGFEQFARETFPLFPLRELGAEHNVYHVQFDCRPYDLQGIDYGCRTSVIYSPRDMSCLWEQADVAGLSERAFELGTNIAAYAMGRRPLIDRLDAVVIPDDPKTDAAPPSRDALRLAQVVYDGDWRPFPRALVELADFSRRELGLNVITQYRTLRLTDDDLYTCPLLYWAGHYDCRLSDEEIIGLVNHLRRGGFVLVDNCCGPEPFDRTFRELMAQVLPDAPLRRLPADHAIFAGKPGFDVRKVQYGPDVQRQIPDLNTPELWGIEIDGRLALVYSPYALGCGLDGSAFAGCWGLATEDARRLAANVVLYALTH